MSDIVVSMEGVSSREDLQKVLEAANADLERFDPYISQLSGGALITAEKALLRSYLVWKLIVDKNPPAKGDSNGSS